MVLVPEGLLGLSSELPDVGLGCGCGWAGEGSRADGKGAAAVNVGAIDGTSGPTSVCTVATGNGGSVVNAVATKMFAVMVLDIEVVFIADEFDGRTLAVL